MMKDSYRDHDLRLGVILLISGILVLLVFILISYSVTGELDRAVGNSTCLVPIGALLVLVAISKIFGAISGTSDTIGMSTSFSCPYCKGAISTKEIPIEGNFLSCPHCKKLIIK